MGISMKPFDLEKALAGEPVVLRCGRKAFITCDLRRYFKSITATKKLVGIISADGDPDSFYASSSWYDSGAYHDADTSEKTDFDIVGIWEEPKLTTEEIMEKAFKEKLVLVHNILSPFCEGYKVVGKTLNNKYILQDLDDGCLQFLHVFNKNLVWSVKN